MAVDEGDTFAEDDGAEVGEESEEVGEGGGRGDCGEGDVVDFEGGEKVADADAVWGVAVGYDYYLRGGLVGREDVQSSGY